MSISTKADVRSAAELERRRLANQAAKARTGAQTEAQQIQERLLREVKEARHEVTAQAAEAREKAAKEALERQAEIRRQQGKIENESEAAKAVAREAQRLELRKLDLPFTKPQNLGVANYIKEIDATRKQAHAEGRTARKDIKKARDEYFKEVDRWETEALANIDKQFTDLQAEIASSVVKAEAEIAKLQAEALSGTEKWKTDALAELAELEAAHIQLNNGEWVAKDSFNKLSSEYQELLMSVGVEGFNEQAEQDIAKFKANHTEVEPDLWVTNEDWDSLSDADKRRIKAIGFTNWQAEVQAFQDKVEPYINEDKTIDVPRLITDYGKVESASILSKLGVENPTHVIKVNTEPEYAFEYYQSIKEIPKFAVFKGTDDKGDIKYEIPPFKNIPLADIKPSANLHNGLENEYLSLDLRTQLDIAEAATGSRWRYDYEPWGIAQSVRTQAEMDQLVADREDRILGYYQYMILSSPNKSEALANLREGLHQEFKERALSIIPVYGTIRNWDDMSTGWRVLSVSLDALFVASLIYGGVASGAFKKIPKIPSRTASLLREIHLSEVGSIGKETPPLNPVPSISKPLLKPVKVIGASEIGMTPEQYTRFLSARVKVPNLTPDTFRYLEAMGQKLTKTIPLPSPAEARAFYGSLLPSYAEIIAKGLPKAIEWKPTQRIWKEGVSPIPTVTSYQQATGLINMTSTQWGQMMRELIPDNLPKGVQREIVVDTVLDLANEAAMASAAVEMAKALKQGKSMAEAKTIGETATKQVLKNALEGATQLKGLTKQQTTAITKLINKGLTQTRVNQITKTITKPAPATQTATKTQTKTKTKTRTKIRALESDGSSARVGKDKYPDGTIVWKMGEIKRGDEYKIIPPPYTMLKPISSKYPPKGMTKTKGTPQETLTFIGGKVPFKNVSFDSGVTDGFIDVKSKTIKFTGRGQQTNVGTRIESTTKGVALKDNPPLLQQLARPGGRRLVRKGQGHSNVTALTSPVRSKKRRLVSHGVYTDRKGTRISRRHHRGWKRIY